MNHPPADDDAAVYSIADDLDGEETVETVMLSLPASGPFGRIARMSGADLALRRGLSLAAVEDLRLAIDEALILLLGDGENEGSLDLEFALKSNAIRIDVVANFDDGPPQLTTEGIERFSELAGPLLSTYELDTDTATLRLYKSSS